MNHTSELVKLGEHSKSSSSPRHDAVQRDLVDHPHQDVDMDRLANSIGSDELEETDQEDADEEDCMWHITAGSSRHVKLTRVDEASRQRRIEENRRLLSSLGIEPIENTVASSSALDPIPTGPKATRKRRKLRPTVYDRSGHIVSLPNPGERHVMACIELPSDRRVRRQIAEGEYTNCADWEEGEDRRWRLGDGENQYQAGEEILVGGVGPDFRWRKWLGLHNELRNELVKRGELNEMDARGTRSTVVLEEGVSSYSLIPGETCHQCKRKSEKEKMRCRNTDPECKASFCSSCCKRYSYFEFDPDSRSFICPLCRIICNCSNCLRKRDLSHLLEQHGERTESLTRKLKRQGMEGMTVEAWLNQAVEDRVGIPFDRVRIVCQDEDIISPELPPEPQPEKVKEKKVKRGRKSNVGQKDHSAKKRKTTETEGKDPSVKAGNPVVIKFKIPAKATTSAKQARTVREKVVDSDGDTVGGWSDDENDNDASHPVQMARSGSDSTLSSISSLSVTPPRRLAFPPRPTSSPFAQQGDHLSMDVEPLELHSRVAGYIHPGKMQHSSAGPENDEIIAQHPSRDSVRGSGTIASSATSTCDLQSPILECHASKNRKLTPSSSNDIHAPKYATHPDQDTHGVMWQNESNLYTGADKSASAATGDTLLGAQIDAPSSPDPLLLRSDTGSLFFDNVNNCPPPYSHSPPRRLPTSAGFIHGNDRLDYAPIETDIDISTGMEGRDTLFPDTPLWYTHNRSTE